MSGRDATRIMLVATVIVATVVLGSTAAGAETEKRQMKPACRAIQKYFDDARFRSSADLRPDLRTALRRARAADADEMVDHLEGALDAMDAVRADPSQSVTRPQQAMIARANGHLMLASAECIEAGFLITPG